MEKDLLRSFYEQELLRDAVRSFMYELMDEMVLRDVYKGGNTDGYKEAKNTVDKLFSRLEEVYGKKDKPLTDNKAR